MSREVEEIEVVAKRKDLFERDFWLLGSGTLAPRGRGEPITPEDFGLPPVAGAFVAPPAVQAIEEIVVTAKRGATAPRRMAITSRLKFGTMRILGILGLAGVAVAMLEGKRKRRQAEEDAIARAETEARRQQKLAQETLHTMPQPQPIPEIVVTAKRSLLPQVLPYPIWPDPDADPAFSPTVEPRFLPETQPAPEPQIEIQPVAPPTIPQPTRAPSVRPQIRPATLPSVRPSVSPLVQPMPFTQPFPSPQARPFPQPSVRPRARAAPRPLTRSQPQPLPFADPSQVRRPDCPPCPKPDDEKDEFRTQCYKKLVKEAFHSEFDESFNWVEIDCYTGREI